MAGASSATSSVAARAGEPRAVRSVQERANGEGEDEAGLTGVAADAGASLGVVGAERDGEGDLRGRSWGRRGRGRLQGGRALGARPVEAVEVGGDEGQHGGARGRRWTRLLRRCEHGGVGHGAGRAEERDWGKRRCLGGRGGRGRSIHASRTARGRSRAAGSCVARRAVAVEHLPACLAEPSSSLERQLGWAGRWAGWAPGKFSLSPFFLFSFLFHFFCSFV